VGDLLVREEVFVKAAPWLQFAGGVDLRGNSHDQVEDDWHLDFADRTLRRPRTSIRRLSATITHGGFTLTAGKQFVSWGKTDILTPADRFAPRDYLSVVDNELLGVLGVRGTVEAGRDTFDVVWLPRFTPSRGPLLDQRWTVPGPGSSPVPIVDGPSVFPTGAETGARWSHVGAGFESSVSFFDGFNDLPNIESRQAPDMRAIEIIRLYPAIRTYGIDLAALTRWVTIRTETAYVTSSTPATDEYALYVVQAERQMGEWMLVAGYAGEVLTSNRGQVSFAPDRGLTRSVIGRVSYTIDSNNRMAIEGAFRQNGDGEYVKAEYSHAHGQHWRTTIMAVGIAGHSDDFIGQYRRNSHVQLVLRYSF
jgi:hypothetical protein